MTALDEVSPPHRRLATYGKAARRRVPDHRYTQLARRSKEENDKQLEPPKQSIASLQESEDHHKSLNERATLSTQPQNTNIYDVPSSDEEVISITKYRAKVGDVVDSTRSRKKIKLSLETEAINSTQSTPIWSVANASSKGRPSAHASLNSAQRNSVSRSLKPNLSSQPKSPVVPQKHLSEMQIHDLADNTSEDVPESASKNLPMDHLSPKGKKIWVKLFKSLECGEEEEHEHNKQNATSNKINHKIESLCDPKDNTIQSAHARDECRGRMGAAISRQRLIDSLANKHNKTLDFEGDSLSERSDSEMTETDPKFEALETDIPPLEGPNLIPDLQNQTSLLSSNQMSQNAGPKFTYSRQRSMLAEADLMEELAFDMPLNPEQTSQNKRPRRGSVSDIKQLPTIRQDDDMHESVSNSAIRSVYELRQAGANTRFIDEIEDLLDRIGSPVTPYSPIRRSSLLEISGKMKDKSFLRQFRVSGTEQRMFAHIGQEVDIISGFLLISILMNLLSDSSMPHVVIQLHCHGITRLLIRLIETEENIMTLAKARSNNMSKAALSLLSEYIEFLLNISSWEDLEPQIISPRTMGLKVLELMIRQSRESGSFDELISKELTTELFSILQFMPEENMHMPPRGNDGIDFHLALSTLESHSIIARTAHDEVTWINKFLPVIVKTATNILKDSFESLELTQVLILRLALNVTNNNSKASDVFAVKSLMQTIGAAINIRLKLMSGCLKDDELTIVIDHLVLLLGVMINLAEWSSFARETMQNLMRSENDPLEGMIDCFIKNQEKTSEADSVEESQKNVAFGYLSVLLGYFSLLPAIADRIRGQYPRKSLRPLIASIEEFICHHKTVDSLNEEDENGHNPHTGLTQRLERLVERLGME